jgi:SAM-dependent methyltransferase
MKPCVACGGRSCPAGHASDGALARCARCGTRAIAVPPTLVASVAGYGRAYRAAADDRKIARLVELFTRRAGATRGAVLDVGCGDGSFLAALRARGWSVTGLDVDPEAVARTRGRGIEAITGAAGSREIGGAFDAVTLWDLIEHIVEPGAVARWLVERVRPGGRLLVLTPDARSAFDRLAACERTITQGLSSRIDDLCLNRYHLHRFSAAGLAALFEAVGFRTESLEPVQLLSLRPERYLVGFAPGIAGWTGHARLDALASRIAFAATRAARLTNKLLYVGTRSR